MGDGEDHRHVVLGEKEGQPALVRDALDEPDGFAGLLGRHPRRRLVEEQDLGLERQRDAELELFLVTVREEPRDLAGLVEKAHGVEQRLGFFPVEAVHARHQVPAASSVTEERRLDVLKYREAREDVGALEGATHAETAEIVGRDTGDLPVLEADAARVGPEVTGDEVEERGLARAVGPDDGADRAARNAEADSAHGLEAVEALAEIADVKQPGASLGGGGPPTPARPRCRRERRRGARRGWCRGSTASTPCRRRSAGSAR